MLRNLTLAAPLVMVAIVASTTLHDVAAAEPATTIYQVDGLSQPAEVLIDEWGVPHVYAQTHYDAFVVQGFNAARDRLWQIDLWRRRGLGLLSQAFGERYVEQDTATRSFLYRGSMHREWLAYGSDAKRIAESFVRGVNAWIDLTEKNPELLAPEFTWLDYKPGRWQPEDVVRIRSNGLWRNVQSEVTRAQVICRFGSVADGLRKVLEPQWRTQIPEGLDPCLISPEVLQRYSKATAAEVRFVDGRLSWSSLAAPLREHLGSNNWVVAGARTPTGRPLLANDPHRSHALPSLRYIVHLNAPGLDVIGAGEPALPGIAIGHNQRIAFGLTIFGLDHEDLYVYQTSSDGKAYRYGDRFEPIQEIEEKIPVRDSAARTVLLKFTRHGPIVLEDPSNRRAFAIRGVWSEPGTAPYFGSVEYMRANNWDEFLAALNRWGAPAENQIYADVEGNIAYRSAGLFPRRINFDGLLPVPGDGRYEWQDFFDADALPYEVNPARGWIATANSLSLPADYPIAQRRVGFEWTAPWRYERIAQVLSQDDSVTVEDALTLQRDYGSIPAQRLTKIVGVLSANNATQAAALSVFNDWHARLERDSAGAALFNLWWHRHLNPALAHRWLPAGAQGLIDRVDSIHLLQEIERDTVGLSPLLLATLQAAYEEAQSLLGDDPSHWKWGDLHRTSFVHPLHTVAPAAMQSQLRLPSYGRGGNGDTPNNTTYSGDSFLVRSGASWRMVIDVGNWDAARMTNAPGQSGDPRSPYFANLLAGWANDESFPLLYSRAAIERHTQHRLELIPFPRP